MPSRRIHHLAQRRHPWVGGAGRGSVSPFWHQSFTAMGDPNSSDPLGWDNTYSSSLILDWYSGDGLTSRVGPDMTVGGGSPTSSIPTPWVLHGGSSVVCHEFDGVSDCLVTSSAPAWLSSGSDCVLVALCCTLDVNYNRMISNRTSDDGIGFLGHGVLRGIEGYVNGASVILPGNGSSPGTAEWAVLALVIDADGVSKFCVNGVNQNQLTTPSGSFYNGTFTLGGENSGAQVKKCRIARFQVYTGPGIATANWGDAYCRKFASVALGIWPTIGTQTPSYTRTGTAIYYAANGPWLLSKDAPPSGSANGLQDCIGRTNKCYRNYALSSGNDSLLSVAGGAATLTTVDDRAALSTAGLHGFGYRVYQVANADSTAAYVYYGAASGGVASYMSSVRARYVAGSGAELGEYSAPDFDTATPSTINDDYAFSGGIVTTDTANCRWAMCIPSGCTLNFLLGNFIQTDHLVGEIASLATASAAVTSTGTMKLDASVQLLDAQGAVEATVQPVRWDGGDDGAVRKLITHTTAAGSYLNLDDASTVVEIGDGTSTASASITEVFGSWNDVRTSWGSGSLYATVVGGTPAITAYDGTMGGSGDISITGTERLIKDFKLYNRKKQKNT